MIAKDKVAQHTSQFCNGKRFDMSDVKVVGASYAHKVICESGVTGPKGTAVLLGIANEKSDIWGVIEQSELEKVSNKRIQKIEDWRIKPTADEVISSVKLIRIKANSKRVK